MSLKRKNSICEELLGMQLKSSQDWENILTQIFTKEDPGILGSDALLLEPHSFVNLHLCLLIADDLLDSNGAIIDEKLAYVRKFFPGGKFLLHPHWQGFELRFDQIARVLMWLEEPLLRKEFEAITLTHEGTVEALIHSVVSILPYKAPKDGFSVFQPSTRASNSSLYSSSGITLRDARCAVLSAWMCYLRQNVGSCFASAPAIVVQQYQPNYFLSDIKQLLGQRGISRVIEGQEFTVPISQSQGDGVFFNTFSEKELKQSPVVRWVCQEVFQCSRVPMTVWRRLFSQTGTASLAKLFQGLIQHQSQQQSHNKKVPSHADVSRLAQLTTSVEQVSGLSCPKLLALREGIARLSDHPLLKIWEFSLASFSETRQQFCRWNLYMSLGMDKSQEGGIGEYLYDALNSKLEEANRETQKVTEELEPLRDRVNYAVSRLNTASSESQMSWLQADYRNVKAEYEAMDRQHIALRSKAQKLAHLYSGLLDCYDNLFPKYFQEVYDPSLGGQLLEQEKGAFDFQYEDRPAGFRLLFKNGSTSLSRWQGIYSGKEYIDALTTFFRVSELEISDQQEFKGIEKELSEVVTGLMLHIRSDHFLKLSFKRLLKEKGIVDPPVELHLLENSLTTPWCFVSGGTMNALVSHYYGRLDEASITRFTPYRCDELWVFLIDTLRAVPGWLREKMDKSPGIPLLMHSGDHAFTLRGNYYPFCKSWNVSQYPYTWIRDDFISPQQELYSQITLSMEQQEALFIHVARRWPQARGHKLFSLKKIEKTAVGAPFNSRARITEFSQVTKNILLTHSEPPRLEKALEAVISSVLWENVPFLDTGDAIDRTEQLCVEFLPGFLGVSFKDNSEAVDCSKMVASRVKHILLGGVFGGDLDQKGVKTCQKTLLLPLGRAVYWNILLSTIQSVFLEKNISTTCFDNNLVKLQEQLYHFNLGPKVPHVFGDSNWPRESLGFVVNPLTLDLEVWRVYPAGTIGFPMILWNEFDKESTYGVFSDPLQYKLA